MRKARTWLAATIVTPLSCIAPAATSSRDGSRRRQDRFRRHVLSCPAAAIGNDMRDGFNLRPFEHLGRQMAGKPVEVPTRTTRRSPRSASRSRRQLDRVSTTSNFPPTMAFRTCFL